jgi:YVTN family beta-propeller protein
MKKLFYFVSICALTAMPFTFTSCSDDDEPEPVVVAPAGVVNNLSFTDTDKAVDKIGGTLEWTLPEQETGIDNYVIYLGGTATEKKNKVGETAKGTKSFDIPAGTDIQAYLIVVARSAAGESTNMASVAIEDIYAKNGFYILNSGNWEANNASLSYYDYVKGTLSTDVYQNANGKGLGDGAEQLLIYGAKMYITVTGSNRLVIVDRDAKEIKSITPEGSEPMNPRCMVADNGKVYVSYYYGHSVAMLDTASLEIEKEVPVGRYPEQLAIANGKIYVANSGGLDYAQGYAKTVSVIDQGTFTVDKEIEVLTNPTQLRADSQGDIYVISMGDYGDIKNTLQRIDGQSHEVTVLGNASYMTLAGDELYTMYAQWDAENVTFKKYNALTEEEISDNFIQDANGISPKNNALAFAVNPVSKQLLVLEAPYTATSSLYMFTPDGKQEGKAIDTGGYASKWITFVNE